MCCALLAGTCASACLGVPGLWCRLAWPPYSRGWTTRMSSLLLMDPSSGHYKTTCRLYTLQRSNTENAKQIFPEKELRCHSPNFHIPLSVSDLYIPTIDLQEICGRILGIYKSLTDTHECLNWDCRLPNTKKEYINGIFAAVYGTHLLACNICGIYRT